MTRQVIAIFIIALITALLRFLPFIIFRSDRKTPDFIAFLGKALPFAIMGMLVVFCLKSVDFLGHNDSSSFITSHGIPEIISILVIMIVHRIKGNSILSILSGTLSYVLIVNLL
ncbi:MAG: AzlD domain-containing protein [Treponema sp.]|nr:AzlD domain-containing protein [Treponema sp.]